MSLRIGSPRLEETQEVYSVYKSSQEQLIGAVYTLSNHIISNSPAGPDSTRFVRDVVQPVSRLDDKLGQLCAKLPNIEKVSSDKEEIVSKKRHFEPEKDQSPTRKKSKIGCSELPSNEGPTANVQPNDSLPRLIFDLEGIDENTFKIAADIQPGDSNAKQVQKSMDYLNKRRGYLCLPPTAYDESVSFVTYEKGFEQMVRVNYLKFWRHIPNGDQFLQKNPNIEYFSSLPELKLALRPFLKTCYLELDYLDLNDAKLVMLPPEIEELSDLTHLEAQNSNLTVLPKEMGKLIHLKELLLNGNELTSLPKEIGDLCQLRNLNLSANDKLMCLPDELEKLTQLGYLDLRFNKLVAFPDWVKDLDSLKKVLFEGNECKVSDYVR